MHRIFLTLLAALFATGAWAGDASERVFSRTALDQVAEREQVVYAHIRKGAIGDKLEPIRDGEIRVVLEADASGARQAVVSMGDAGRLQPVSRFPAGSGNPLVPIFLESTLRTMARVTGGSEFYIRNRIKEALGAGGTMAPLDVDLAGKQVKGTEIVFEPFLGDKNRHRMGEFADLKLIFVVSDQLPGDVVRFRAATGDDAEAAYLEEISFKELIGEE